MKTIKLVNYKRGYTDKFDCSIHGTIYITREEWKKFVEYIVKNKKLLDPYGGYSNFKTFCDDTSRRIETKQGYLINIRVTATGILADHYKLDNYKKGNYQIYVK